MSEAAKLDWQIASRKEGDYSRLEAMVRRVVGEMFASAQHQSPRKEGDYSHLEAMVRRVVREERPPTLQGHRHLCPGCEETLHQAETSGSRALRLCFTNRLPEKIFTDTRITSEDAAPIGIVLRDARSQNCIVREGPLSRSRIMMYALKDEFGSNGSEDWSEVEFNVNILTRRKNKGELLSGKSLIITLENGEGFVPDIHFTDNSSWTRSRKFRLGAKAVENEANIREGRSEAFVVMDRRGKLYEKHDRPSLEDEIWRLKKIAKNGEIHKRLSLYKVKTVRDLLRLYVMNPPSFLENMGKVAKKSWETIIEHARSCEIDDSERYVYQYLTTAQQPMRLIFNSIYELVEVGFDGRSYRPLELPTSEEKRVVEIAKRNAYDNVETWSIYGSTNTFADAGQPSRPALLGELILEDEQEGTDQMATPQVGIAPNGGPPQQVDLPATQQGQWLDWGLLGDNELHYSPSSFLDEDFQLFLHSDAPPSTSAGHKSKKELGVQLVAAKISVLLLHVDRDVWNFLPEYLPPV
ncbi:hypothetical protein K1719_024759 [Acacia pycnantha]|nr:hypothetical protein K1719_024759 [Acacia pycnantha]